jgi:glycosyltransferase involved in cell wall biosynthesis
MIDYRLVLVGEKDYFYRRLEEEAKRMRIDENVVFYGKASDAELAQLYDNAVLFVFPSLCEGFGLPPLEAMCRGVPVIASKASCLPEILDEAAFFCDPESADDIAAAMERVVTDAKLRAGLVAKGRARASRFDWRSCAEETRKAYAYATRA